MSLAPISPGSRILRKEVAWYRKKMKNPSFVNLTVFVLFFGLALIEAVQQGNWLSALLFAALGVLSLWADFKKN